MIPIGYECLPANISFNFTMKVEKCIYSPEEIWAVCDAFYSKIAQKYTKLSTDKDDDVLLRLGQGSSAFATSFLLLAEDLGINDYKVNAPKTRKETLAEELMGWALVRGTRVRQSATPPKTQSATNEGNKQKERASNVQDLAAAWGAKLNKK